MIQGQARHIVFVDDEPTICRVVARTLGGIGLQVRCFTRAADCFKKLPDVQCDLLITDLIMPEMDGMELLRKVKHIMPSLPVLMLTGYGDIPTAVEATKAGACDFIEKPLSREVLISIVTSILEQTTISQAPGHKALTPREKTVLQMILAGKNNREIAHLLHRTIKTAEFHRGNIMRKLGVHNAVELTEKAISLGMGLHRHPDIGG